MAVYPLPIQQKLSTINTMVTRRKKQQLNNSLKNNHNMNKTHFQDSPMHTLCLYTEIKLNRNEKLF